MSEYKIKFGKLKGLTPEEAFSQGEIEELTKIRNSLTKNFGNPKYRNIKKLIYRVFGYRGSSLKELSASFKGI